MRTCARPGCPTRLSAYNTDAYCHRHREPLLLRVRSELLEKRPLWQTFAACRGRDTETFFPELDASTAVDPERLALARAICAGCPVIEFCAEWTLRTEAGAAYRYGVFAGLTPDERAQAAQEADPLAAAARIAATHHDGLARWLRCRSRAEPLDHDRVIRAVLDLKEATA